MSDVHLITAMFASVDRLTNILQVRNISFPCADGLEQENIPSFICNTLIISDAYMNKVGRMSSFLEIPITF